MRWSFVRGSQTIRIEAHANDDKYVVSVRWPNGRCDTQKISGVDAVLVHLLNLERQLNNSRFFLRMPAHTSERSESLRHAEIFSR